jgi:hypothetical protein
VYIRENYNNKGYSTPCFVLIGLCLSSLILFITVPYHSLDKLPTSLCKSPESLRMLLLFLSRVSSRHQYGSFSDYSDQEPESPFALKPRPFFRRFSFRGITRGKSLNIFHKQGSDEVELNSGNVHHNKYRMKLIRKMLRHLMAALWIRIVVLFGSGSIFFFISMRIRILVVL